ncbi:MAG: hypothetical protein P1V97_36455 [Planctomycetota bacterium]|nr:hypothetical protein [Planctomycetota bacterium]
MIGQNKKNKIKKDNKMKESIYLLLTIATLGWAIWTESERIPPLKDQIHELQNAKPKDNPRQAERIEELEDKLQEASKIGLDFKEELDATRKEVQELENELKHALTKSDRTESYTTRQYTPDPTPYTPSKPDNSAQISELENNLRKGQNLVNQIESERPPFKTRSSSPSLGRSGFGAGRNGITTSQADQKRWHDNKKARLDNARAYVEAVEDKLHELRSQQ